MNNEYKQGIKDFVKALNEKELFVAVDLNDKSISYTNGFCDALDMLEKKINELADKMIGENNEKVN